jgi:hypothetical protein
LKHPKFGRPPLAPERVRSNRVVTFVTNDELNMLQEMTAKTDTSLSALCHHILADYLKTNYSRSSQRN